MLPKASALAVNTRQAELLHQAHSALLGDGHLDLLLVSEDLRLARIALDRLVGRAGVEEMLDAVFARFCIGK